MTQVLHQRIGFEIELLAPRGASRRTLALALAARVGGLVRPVWHRDTEPSLVPGMNRFLHLTQGFEVISATGAQICTLVDDVTLIADLDPRTHPAPGWFRVLTDDVRLLRLLAQQCDPAGTAQTALIGIGALWGVQPQQMGQNYRLDDPGGVTIALAAPQGGERERGCEIVTPPLTDNHGQALTALLGPARELGFTVPVEAAVHLHLDGAPFRDPATLANVIRLFAHWREQLHSALETNPACRRLAKLPAQLVALTDAHTPTFDELAAGARAGRLTKFFDVNLTQLFAATPLRETLEIRILPGTLDPNEILARAALVERLLVRCLDPTPISPTDRTIGQLLSPALHGSGLSSG